MEYIEDKQKKKIIARYVEIQNYRQVAREFGISDATVRNICKKNPDVLQRCAQKKEQNTLDMLEYLNSRKAAAQEFLDLALEALKDPEKIKKSSLQSIATSMGIVVDKFTQMTPQAAQKNELLESLLQLETEARLS